MTRCPRDRQSGGWSRAIELGVLAIAYLILVAFGLGILLLLGSVVFSPGGCAAAGRTQGVDGGQTESTAHLTSAVETVARDVRELSTVVKHSIDTDNSRNSGDNWTTRLVVVAAAVVGSIAVIWHRKRFHRKNGRIPAP